MVEVQFPLLLGSPEDFALVRSFLKRASFDEATICRGLALESLARFVPAFVDTPDES